MDYMQPNKILILKKNLDDLISNHIQSPSNVMPHI